MISHLQSIINNRGSLNSLREPSGYRFASKRRGCPAWLLAKLKLQADARFCVNPFENISHLCEVLKLPQSRFAFGWRLSPCELGEINGIPGSRGLIVATDGMMCLIYRSDDSWFIGHKEYWIPDEVEIDENELSKVVKEPKTKKRKASVEEIDVILES